MKKLILIALLFQLSTTGQEVGIGRLIGRKSTSDADDQAAYKTVSDWSGPFPKRLVLAIPGAVGQSLKFSNGEWVWVQDCCATIVTNILTNLVSTTLPAPAGKHVQVQILETNITAQVVWKGRTNEMLLEKEYGVLGLVTNVAGMPMRTITNQWYIPQPYQWYTPQPGFQSTNRTIVVPAVDPERAVNLPNQIEDILPIHEGGLP